MGVDEKVWKLIYMLSQARLAIKIWKNNALKFIVENCTLGPPNLGVRPPSRHDNDHSLH